MEQLWECPECGVIVKVTEVLPPLVLDAEKVIERKMLTLRVSGLGKIMQRFRLGLPFFRLGCWLADMDLELEESEERPSSSVWTDPPLLRENGEPVILATLDALDNEYRYKKYQALEDHANALKAIDKWYDSEKARWAGAE